MGQRKHIYVEGRCYARVNAAENFDIRVSEFEYITEVVMKVSADALTVKAARLVLLEGRTQSQACADTGCRVGALSTCLTRIRTHHQRALQAFSSRMPAITVNAPSKAKLAAG